MRAISPTLLSVLLTSTATAQEWRALFDGRSLAGWTTTIRDREPGDDPEQLVQVRDGAIHMYADVPAGREVPFGIVTHDDELSRFHLRFEYRWIGKRFAPRAEALRDAGFLFHVKDHTKVWPACVECQIQEGDTGDLVWIHTGGLTWMHPDPARARAGQGEPGLLPEDGGVPRLFAPKWPYVGRFEEADSPSGWNRVDIYVHADERAEHVVNGRTIVRMSHLIDERGAPLRSGRVAFQLEAAELQYRAIEVRELDAPAAPDRSVVSLSAVAGKRARTRTLRVQNPGGQRVEGMAVTGRDRDAFRVVAGPDALAPGGVGEWQIAFTPTRGAGRYSAGLALGDAADGAFVVLQGVGLAAFEGENEPPLQRIVHALGVPVDVGGAALSLDRDAARIGDGVDARYFTAVGDGRVRVTPVARFSPTGATPIGVFVEGDDARREVGRVADSDVVEDAHQCLMPPVEGGGQIVFDAPEAPFGFYMEGRHYVSHTDPARPTEAKIAHTARVYPARVFQGRRLDDAWLVCFEEASNGDYQDLVLLVEGIRPR